MNGNSFVCLFAFSKSSKSLHFLETGTLTPTFKIQYYIKFTFFSDCKLSITPYRASCWQSQIEG